MSNLAPCGQQKPRLARQRRLSQARTDSSIHRDTVETRIPIRGQKVHDLADYGCLGAQTSGRLAKCPPRRVCNIRAKRLSSGSVAISRGTMLLLLRPSGHQWAPRGRRRSERVTLPYCMRTHIYRCGAHGPADFVGENFRFRFSGGARRRGVGREWVPGTAPQKSARWQKADHDPR